MNDDVLTAMAELDEPVMTLGEIADAMDKSKSAVYDRVEELVDEESVRRKKVGARAVVFWLPEQTKELECGGTRLVGESA